MFGKELGLGLDNSMSRLSINDTIVETLVFTRFIINKVIEIPTPLVLSSIN